MIQLSKDDAPSSLSVPYLVCLLCVPSSPLWLKPFARGKAHSLDPHHTKAKTFIIGNVDITVKPWHRPRFVTITIFFNSLEGFLVPTSGTPAGPARARLPAAHLRHRSAQDRYRTATQG